jgi:hypothetical protein
MLARLAATESILDVYRLFEGRLSTQHDGHN